MDQDHSQTPAEAGFPERSSEELRNSSDQAGGTAASGDKATDPAAGPASPTVVTVPADGHAGPQANYLIDRAAPAPVQTGPSYTNLLEGQAERWGGATPGSTPGSERRVYADPNAMIKMFLGQVPKSVGEDELRARLYDELLNNYRSPSNDGHGQYFRPRLQAEHLATIQIIRNRTTNNHCGCAFVTVAGGYPYANEFVYQFQDRFIWKNRDSPLQAKFADGELEKLEHKLFVGQIPKNINEEELLPFFQRYGDVTECAIIRNQSDNSSNGCAFVKFSSRDSAESAMKGLQGTIPFPSESTAPLNVRWADGNRARQTRMSKRSARNGGSSSSIGSSSSLEGARGRQGQYHYPNAYGRQQHQYYRQSQLSRGNSSSHQFPPPSHGYFDGYSQYGNAMDQYTHPYNMDGGAPPRGPPEDRAGFPRFQPDDLASQMASMYMGGLPSDMNANPYQHGANYYGNVPAPNRYDGTYFANAGENDANANANANADDDDSDEKRFPRSREDDPSDENNTEDKK